MRATLPLALCTIAVLALSWQVAGGLSRDRTAARVDFAEEVLPILASNCFRCHGGVREKAGLNLSDPERVRSILASGHWSSGARARHVPCSARHWVARAVHGRGVKTWQAAGA